MRQHGAVAVAAALGLSAAAHAQTASAQPAPAASSTAPSQSAAPAGVNGPWQTDVTPFFWLPSMAGHVTLRGFETEANSTFLETIGNVSSFPISLMGEVDVHNDKWGVFIQPIFMQLSFAPSGRFFRSDITTTNFYLEFGGFYTLANGAFSPGSDWQVQAIAGGRYTQLDLKASLALNDPLPFGPGGLSASGQQDWVDPFIGLRTQIGLGRDFMLAFRGDIGGFGAGSSFSWNLQGLIGYNFTMFGAPATAFIGYKGLYQNYQTGSGRNEFKWDEVFYGPAFGITTHF